VRASGLPRSLLLNGRCRQAAASADMQILQVWRAPAPRLLLRLAAARASRLAAQRRAADCGADGRYVDGVAIEEPPWLERPLARVAHADAWATAHPSFAATFRRLDPEGVAEQTRAVESAVDVHRPAQRSEERRVGKESGCRGVSENDDDDRRE